MTLEIVTNGDLRLITDHRGYPVYGNTRGTADALFCADAECTTAWPPLEPRDRAVAADLDLARFAIIARPDGSEQVVYNGVPLYLWSGDRAIGIPGGAGVAGIWFAMTADGARVD